MSENQTASTATTVSGGSTSANNTPPPSGQPIKIKMGAVGGGFSLDEFKRAKGEDVENKDEPDEPDTTETDRGELIDPPEATPSPKVKEDSDEEDEDTKIEEATEEEESKEGEEADLEELSSSTKKGIKAFTKEGKALTLPPDLEIEQMVDGEPRKINLREHLNVVAGELTVQSRIGKVSSFREEVEKRRQDLERGYTKFNNDINTLVDFAKQGKPDLAICFLAEMNGVSPIQMKKQFLKSLVAEATRFEGKSELEIENYYLNLENQWQLGKQKKAREAEQKKQNFESFISHVTNELKKENLLADEFIAAKEELSNNGSLNGLSQDATLDRVIEHALLKKHSIMAHDAIEQVDPKLVKNRKLIDLLLEHTHPNKFSVEEMANVVRTYLGKETTRIASNLSKKVGVPKTTTSSEKQNGAGKKQRIYRSQADLARAFGL